MRLMSYVIGVSLVTAASDGRSSCLSNLGNSLPQALHTIADAGSTQPHSQTFVGATPLAPFFFSVYSRETRFPRLSFPFPVKIHFNSFCLHLSLSFFLIISVQSCNFCDSFHPPRSPTFFSFSLFFAGGVLPKRRQHFVFILHRQLALSQTPKLKNTVLLH